MPKEYGIEIFKIVSVTSFDDSFMLFLLDENNNSFFCQQFYFNDPATDFLFFSEDVLAERRWESKKEKLLNKNVSLMVEKIGNDPIRALAVINNGVYFMINSNNDVRSICETEFALQEQGLGTRRR